MKKKKPASKKRSIKKRLIKKRPAIIIELPDIEDIPVINELPFIKKGRKKRRRRSSKKQKVPEWFTLDRLQLAVTLTVLMVSVFFLTKSLVGQITESGEQWEQIRELSSESSGKKKLREIKGPGGRPEIQQDFLTPNPYSRSQIPIKRVKAVVIHYVANPGTSAQGNRDYFEGLKDSHLTKASSHFIIGLSGEIIQCIPLDEISYASNQRNRDTISIECCHPGEDGKFNDDTYRSLVRLAAWLCDVYGLEYDDVIRHYDVTGKMCPLYYVEHEDAWDRLREEIQDQRK